ncbi:MAG: type II toxin-antitoxin system RelE/ParE family toxin [Tannerella sp.]|jgi:plasmid stabilization system protein ParE|nr:type II toxin-antitoxin system RelE/ParE family toxin [Tannerella sp.]
MEVNWSDKARFRVREIFDFYNIKSSRAASKLIEDIADAGNSLSKFPQMAAIEPVLSDLPIAYRALVVRENYKIIYFVNENVNIVTVWDCRQDDKKLKKEIG